MFIYPFLVATAPLFIYPFLAATAPPVFRHFPLFRGYPSVYVIFWRTQNYKLSFNIPKISDKYDKMSRLRRSKCVGTSFVYSDSAVRKPGGEMKFDNN